MITHALCIRAQDQSLNAWKAVRPRYTPGYSGNHNTPMYSFHPRAWSDVVCGKLYAPELGPMPAAEYFVWKMS